MHCVIAVSYRLTICGIVSKQIPTVQRNLQNTCLQFFQFLHNLPTCKATKNSQGKDIPVREDTMGHIYGHKMILLMLDILTNISIFPQELTHLVFLQYHGTGTMEATA